MKLNSMSIGSFTNKFLLTEGNVTFRYVKKHKNLLYMLFIKDFRQDRPHRK